MYVTVLVMPVPEENIDAYKDWAKLSAGIFKDYGCTEVVDSWEDFVPIGKNTDFFKAVKAEPGEKIAFSWQIWPSKEAPFRCSVQKRSPRGQCRQRGPLCPEQAWQF